MRVLRGLSAGRLEAGGCGGRVVVMAACGCGSVRLGLTGSRLLRAGLGIRGNSYSVVSLGCIASELRGWHEEGRGIQALGPFTPRLELWWPLGFG